MLKGNYSSSFFCFSFKTFSTKRDICKSIETVRCTCRRLPPLPQPQLLIFLGVYIALCDFLRVRASAGYLHVCFTAPWLFNFPSKAKWKHKYESGRGLISCGWVRYRSKWIWRNRCDIGRKKLKQINMIWKCMTEVLCTFKLMWSRLCQNLISYRYLVPSRRK